jgi:hypothetical protein
MPTNKHHSSTHFKKYTDNITAGMAADWSMWLVLKFSILSYSTEGRYSELFFLALKVEAVWKGNCWHEKLYHFLLPSVFKSNVLIGPIILGEEYISCSSFLQL